MKLIETIHEVEVVVFCFSAAQAKMDNGSADKVGDQEHV